MTSNRAVTVFGAYGHIGRFVVSELRSRGWTPILSGRDAAKLNAVGDAHPVRTTGVVAAGEVFDAQDFLRSLSLAHLSLEI